MPVQVAGFDDLPEAGSYFEVISKEQYIRSRAGLRDERKNKQMAFAGTGKNVLTCIVKTDTDSSKEALLGSLLKLSKKIKHEFNVIQAGVGDVTESDVMLAANTGASLIVFHAKVNAQAKELIRKHHVRLYQFDIIYKLLEALEALVESKQEIEMVRTKIGEAEVRKVFDVKNIGVIAGCYVKEGIFSRDGIVVGWHGRQKIGEGKIRSLQRDKKSVKEVHTGYECGFIVEGIDSWQEGDRVECYIDKPVEKKSAK
jgi:translation initiation factor IF-2